MWKRLQKFVGGVGKAEAEAAHSTAELDYQAAVRQAAEIDRLIAPIMAHGAKNHIGARVNAGITANLAALAAATKGA